MKITINKSAKRVLSLVLAITMLVGSLFVANAGVTFVASAATVEDTWDGTKVEPTTTDADGNIIITSAEEFAWLALVGGDTTIGKTYKVADGVDYFNMNGMSGITPNSTATDVKNATPTGGNFQWKNDSAVFKGNFDGNGVIIYNIYGYKGSAYGGLFPNLTLEKGSFITIKNLSVKASAFFGFHRVGGLAGNTDGQFTVDFNECVVDNCYLAYYSGDGGGNKFVGTIVGQSGNVTTNITNCLVIDNIIESANSSYSLAIKGGFIAQASTWAPSTIKISNSVSIGTSPYPTVVTSGTIGDDIVESVWTNVYTDQTDAARGTILTNSQMTGTAATQNMALDFSGTWFANTAGAPELRQFHNITAKNNGDTHSEVCADCGLVGLTVEHYYNDVNYDSNTTSCVCGQFIFGTHDVWDGTKASGFAGGSGTEADPYIIKTVEQLFLMVRSTGIKDGKPVYYKVDDNVNALYINDTRAFADQAAFEAAAGSLKNWSTGLTKESDFCGDTANCYYTEGSTQLSNHRDGYVDYFGGRFDGNGVTIYGLYSMTTAANHWNNGTGFVPMLTGDAVIKNVTFDTNYVKSNTAATGVITSSLGIWVEQYRKEIDGVQTVIMCPKVLAHTPASDKCNASIINVAVRNSYIEATSYTDWNNIVNSCVSGYVASIRAPKSLNISNCLFDGTNSKLIDNVEAALATNQKNNPDKTYTTAKRHTAFVSTFDSNTNSTITGCAYVSGGSGVDKYSSCETYQVEKKDENGNSTGEFYTVSLIHNCNKVGRNEFTVEEAPTLNWLYWETVDGKPTPAINNHWITDSYKNQGEYNLSWRKNKVLTAPDAYGTAYEYSALRGNRGVFNDYNTLVGSGTEADPYIINDADTLYMIIASGGTHYGVPQYYKLGCNIDLEGRQWVDTDIFENTTYDVVFYDYQPFAGTIDGDGHTISNLYTASPEDVSAGFIPELTATGVVKNINFRNCYAYSESEAVAIIAGKSEVGSQIINCSIEDSEAADWNATNELVGYYTYDENATVTDCYVVKADSSVEYSDGTAPTLDGVNWYGITGGIARPVSFAKSQPCADINADGLGEEYDTSDVTALKNNLLWKDGYDYIYGDVSGNGATDMRDLAALQRIISGQETTEYDGFWANVKAGKFTIYYTGDSDNYDFARKLELHLESMTGTDVEKTDDGSASKYAVKLVTSGDANTWSYTYDIDNAVLTFTGGSFTAVEAAVDHFIQNVSLFDLPQETTGTIDSTKNAVTVGGKTYYYAWGDEFNSDVNGTVNYDNWVLRNKGTDDTPGKADTEFEYIRAATDAEAKDINVVKDGKLTLKRGFTGATASDEYKFYMSGISSKDSMLFKQGYLEMVAAVPSDGYSFPAWWLLTHDVGNGNVTIDKSLYSKVFERNGVYNGTSTYATPTDVTSYKYKLPTQTLEMDLFEIIQRPTKIWGIFSSPSDDHNIKFNIHKWYTYSLDKNDNSLAVYDLDWANAPTSGAFQTKLLTASGATGGEGYEQDSASILVNSGNLSGGGVNGAATYQGAVTTMQYDMESLRSNGQITSRKYGFLWTADEMTFTVYTDAAGTSVLYTRTVNKNDMNFGSKESYSNSDTFGFDQYAYMLIENHIFTAQKSSNGWYEADYDEITDCDLVIDYVRLYQLDGARAIITPESESIYDR